MTSEWQDSVLGLPTDLARQIVPHIERTILQLVVDGFQRWKAEGFGRYGDHEDDYTVRLVAFMKQIRRERNLPLVPRFRDVEPSDAMLEGQEDSARAPCIDITVLWGVFTDDIYFSIECKRLAPDDLARLYVTEGMMRFVRGYYGAKAQTGGMVGYIVWGTPNSIFHRVNSNIKADPALGPGHALSPTLPIGWLKDVFVSKHARAAPLPTVRLTHLFFDLTGLPTLPTARTGRTDPRQQYR